MSDLLEFIRAVGFPAAVAGFVLWRLEARLKELADTITQLRLCILATLERRAPPAREPE